MEFLLFPLLFIVPPMAVPYIVAILIMGPKTYWYRLKREFDDVFKSALFWSSFIFLPIIVFSYSPIFAYSMGLLLLLSVLEVVGIIKTLSLTANKYLVFIKLYGIAMVSVCVGMESSLHLRIEFISLAGLFLILLFLGVLLKSRKPKVLSE